MTLITAICVAVIFSVSIYMMLGGELKSIAMGVFMLGHAANLSIIAMSGSPAMNAESANVAVAAIVATDVDVVTVAGAAATADAAAAQPHTDAATGAKHAGAAVKGKHTIAPPQSNEEAAIAAKEGLPQLKRPPILTEGEHLVDPLPQALILTAIVIGFAVMGFLLTLIVITSRKAESIDVDELAKEQLPTV